MFISKSVCIDKVDMDVYNVRLARVRIIELGNDLKAITEDMGRALEGVHESQLSSLNAPQREEVVRKRRPGFSRVNSVARNSPAEAGVSEMVLW